MSVAYNIILALLVIHSAWMQLKLRRVVLGHHTMIMGNVEYIKRHSELIDQLTRTSLQLSKNIDMVIAIFRDVEEIKKARASNTPSLDESP